MLILHLLYQVQIVFSGMEVHTPNTDRLPPFFTVESVSDYYFNAGARSVLLSEENIAFPPQLKTEDNDEILIKHLI